LVVVLQGGAFQRVGVDDGNEGVLTGDRKKLTVGHQANGNANYLVTKAASNVDKTKVVHCDRNNWVNLLPSDVKIKP
jgi:hypothetical protein